MIRAHVDKDGRLIMPAGQSIDELLDKDVLILVAPSCGEPPTSGDAGQGGPLQARQGIYRRFTGNRSGQSLRFEDGVLVFDAGVGAEVVDARTIERLVQQDREDCLHLG